MASKHIVVLGDKETVSAFRLAGVREAYTVDEGNAEETYDKIKDGASLILVTRGVEKMLGEKISELRRSTLVQVIPEGAEDYSAVLRSLIKDTIGFDLGA